MNINNNTTKLVFKDEKPDSVISTTRCRQPNILIKYLNNYSKLIIDLDNNTTITKQFSDKTADKLIKQQQQLINYRKMNSELCKRFAKEWQANQIGK